MRHLHACHKRHPARVLAFPLIVFPQLFIRSTNESEAERTRAMWTGKYPVAETPIGMLKEDPFNVRKFRVVLLSSFGTTQNAGLPFATCIEYETACTIAG